MDDVILLVPGVSGSKLFYENITTKEVSSLYPEFLSSKASMDNYFAGSLNRLYQYTSRDPVYICSFHAIYLIFRMCELLLVYQMTRQGLKALTNY